MQTLALGGTPLLYNTLIQNSQSAVVKQSKYLRVFKLCKVGIVNDHGVISRIDPLKILRGQHQTM